MDGTRKLRLLALGHTLPRARNLNFRQADSRHDVAFAPASLGFPQKPEYKMQTDYSLAYSALARFRIGRSSSAPFQSVRKR